MTIPDSWATSTVGTLFSLVGGGTPRRDEREFWDGEVPWISSADIDDSFRLHPRRSVTTRGLANSTASAAPPNSVIVVTRVGLGKVGLVGDRPTCFSQDCQALFPTEGMDPRFTAYQLKWLARGFQRRSRGTTVSGITKRQLSESLFYVPTSHEQVRIADALDNRFSELDAGVAALERARAKLATYRASVLKAAVDGTLTAEWRKWHPNPEPATELLERIRAVRRRRWVTERTSKFRARDQEPSKSWKAKYADPAIPDASSLPVPEGWSLTTTGQLCDFITKGTTPPGSDAPRGSGEVPFIKVQHLSATGTFGFSNSPSFVSRVIHEGLLARSKVFPRDVLMSIVGPPLGQISIVPTLFPEWNVNQAIAIFRPNHGFSHRFLAICLLSRPVLSQALRRAKTTAGQVNLTLEVCRDLVVPVPPAAEQKAIVEAVEEQTSVIDYLESDLEVKLRAARALRQSILHHAFTGQLVPQDPNDEPTSVLLKRIGAEREAHTRRSAAAKRVRSLIGRGRGSARGERKIANEGNR